ncbi:MAG TPA: polysaccharide deacetylase family protein [Leucothrix mucor]|uniref:Polysaccharide deacetylase family protein n=1 Tax=Leucothrix mucor TaxID=45248 RepID=A0A7V2WV64_LEUMU|nr:polysaccharide deacetylase family protein [Leucothrix mucor]
MLFRLFAITFLCAFFNASALAQDCAQYRAKYNCPADKRFKLHLSFDDGVGSVTPQILDVLKRERIPATFFVLGNKVDCQQYRKACIKGGNHKQKSCQSLQLCQQRRQTLKRIKREGHLIGSHSYQHHHHSKLSPAELQQTIARSKKILQPFFTTKPIPFRLPYGDGWFNQKEQPQVMKALKQQGFIHIGWEMSGYDWNKKNQQGTKILDNVMTQMCSGRNGSVLLHDGVFENEHEGRLFTGKHLAEWIPVLRCVADFVPLSYFKKELK